MDKFGKYAVRRALTRLLRNAGRDKPPKFFSKAVSARNKKMTWEGYRRQGSEGTDSLVAFLPMMAAEKLIGKARVRNAIWKHINSPALKSDTAIGHALSKVPGAKRLFTTTEKVPWGSEKQKLFKEIERSSALAPLVKLRDVGAPIIVGVGLEKGLGKVTDLAKGHTKGRDPMDSDLREKVASALLRLNSENKEHTKRAHATRLLYKKAELGLEHVPASYGAFQEKVAQLMTQDLVVLEKALELTAGATKLGELDMTRVYDLNPSEKFQAAVLGEET